MLRRALPLVLALSALACGSRPRARDADDDAQQQAGRRDRRHPLARITSDDERVRSKAYSDLTELLNRGPLGEAEVAPYAEDVQRLLDEHLDRAEPAQRPEPITCGSWADRRDYVMLRWETELLVDVGAAVPGPRMEKSLRRALRLSDGRFRYFALRSLVLRGAAVDAKAIEAVAAVDEVRGKLFHLLEERGRRAEFPAAWATQEALARGRLVDWLQWDKGLACVPRAIELGKIVTIGDADWFVFRFSPEGSRRTERAMLAGVAGPYAKSSEPTAEGGDQTSSLFEPYDAKTPEEHVRAVIEEPGSEGGDGTKI